MVGDPNNRSDRASAALQRDAALGRIVRTRRWLLVAAAALTAGLAALASALLPGKSLGAKVHATHATSKPVARRSSAPVLPPPAGAAALGLKRGDSNSEGSDPGESSSGAGNSGDRNSGDGNSGDGNSGSGNSGSQAAQSQPAPQPAPAPAPAPSGNSGNSGGGVTSGGS